MKTADFHFKKYWFNLYIKICIIYFQILGQLKSWIQNKITHLYTSVEFITNIGFG